MPSFAVAGSDPPSVEMRDEARRCIDAPPGRALYVRNRSRHLAVHGVRDVSARGISVIIDGRLEAGEPVLIESDDGQTLVEYCAFVVWCRPLKIAEMARYIAPSMVGLRVYGPRSLGNLLM